MMGSHLIDVGVPHLAQEPEGRWGVRVINRELDQSLQHRTVDDYLDYKADLLLGYLS